MNVETQRVQIPVVAAFPAAQRREAERSDAERSAAAGKAATTARPLSPPDPEVPVKARRRRFTADYKLRILDQAETALESRAVGALLRREGLYSSHLVAWRRERQSGIREALTPHKRGPKFKHNPLTEENEKLRRENRSLAERLRKAEIVIEVQKKVAALLCPIQTSTAREEIL